MSNRLRLYRRYSIATPTACPEIVQNWRPVSTDTAAGGDGSIRPGPRDSAGSVSPGKEGTMDEEIAAVTGEYESPEVETKLLISRQCN